ncbi:MULTISPECIES: hypothetical protein [Actinomycetes]|uniref:TetR family transcriptional regulator n=2 Tax=Actinomycetes TaxID=1760 RepID=A0ABP6LSG5_9MICC
MPHRVDDNDLAAARAVREVITAVAVHRDAQRAGVLVAEHLDTFGVALVRSASAFIAHHTTNRATPELATDRFHYLLTRIGGLIELAADMDDLEPEEMTVVIVEHFEASVSDESERQAFQAAQTCLVAQMLIRRGRPPWGIQRSLDLEDMLVLNTALAEILVLVSCSLTEEALGDVFVVLLKEAQYILARQAQARGWTVEKLIENYFLALSAGEVEVRQA